MKYTEIVEDYIEKYIIRVEDFWFRFNYKNMFEVHFKNEVAIYSTTIECIRFVEEKTGSKIAMSDTQWAGKYMWSTTNIINGKWFKLI